jgi:hypothetical protein
LRGLPSACRTPGARRHNGFQRPSSEKRNHSKNSDLANTKSIAYKPAYKKNPKIVQNQVKDPTCGLGQNSNRLVEPARAYQVGNQRLNSNQYSRRYPMTISEKQLQANRIDALKDNVKTRGIKNWGT